MISSSETSQNNLNGKNTVAMKKYIIPIIALCAALSSCSKDSAVPAKIESSPSEFLPGFNYESLVVRTGERSKTSLDGTSCAWTEDDSFKVYSNPTSFSQANTFTQNGDNSFEGKVPEGTTEIYAVYSNQRHSCSFSGGKFVANVTIPTTQAPVSEDFDANAHVALAHGIVSPEKTSTSVTFHTANRLIKVSVPENVTSVELSSETAIAGALTLSYDGVSIAMTGTASSNSIVLSDGGKVITAGIYYLCVAPVDMVGFQMTYTFTDGSTYTRSSSKKLEMAGSNQIRNLTMSVPMPGIAIDGFYSTYDYYVGNDFGKANDASNRLRLSEGEIIANDADGWNGIKYGYEVDGQEVSNLNSGTGLAANVKSVGKKTVTGKIFCAGVIQTATLQRDVTGLPFIDESISAANFTNWKTSNASIANGGIALKGAATTSNCGYAVSDAFHVPSPIPTQVTIKAKSSAGLSTSNSNVYIGSTSSQNTPSTSNTVSINNRVSEKSTTTTLTDSDKYISFRAAMIAGLTQTISSVKILYK